ncbi:MAG: DUF1080 domain-containing protein [Methanoregula sp.]|nr:DUF1080 domain-containing protein [Methanoregula sp.]
MVRLVSAKLGTLLLALSLSLIPANGQQKVKTLKNPSPSAYSRNPERIVTIAVLQAGTKHFQNGNPGLEANFALFVKLARQAAAAQPLPELICFPEFAISGWRYPAQEVINSLAESIPGTGNWYQRYRDLAREIGIPIICWLVESENNKLYNTAFMLDGKGEFKGKYRKTHPTFGEQTSWGWSQGERFELIELDSVRYGVSICNDMWFPETVRCLELLGADVVLHLSIGDDMGHIIPVRAFDSKMPIVASIFSGGSYGVDAEGKILGKLPAEDPGWKAFQIHPFTRHLGKKYGVYDEKKGQQNNRNVEAYSILTDPATRPPWTEIFLDDAGRPHTREELLQRFNGHYDAHDPASPATKTVIREISEKEYNLTPEEKAEGFVALFNGRNLDNWMGNKVSYVAKDAMIVCKPNDDSSGKTFATKDWGGNLYTEKEYVDFIFRFEFLLTPAANNGLGIRAPLTGDAAYVGMELQILDNTAPVYANLQPYQYHGSVYGVIPAKTGFLKPVGEWNYEEVIVKGTQIKVILNGTTIVDGDIAGPRDNGTMDHKDHPGLKNKTGHIGFLGHGAEIYFRNIRMKDLSQ